MAPTGQSLAASTHPDDMVFDPSLHGIGPDFSPATELAQPPADQGHVKGASGIEASPSRFTYRHLADLAAASPTCPLRVITHIDLDAYYAQCEMRRLGTADDTPLVVQQWRNIIAVNYPARAYGINRMILAAEAKRLCPHLVLQHVPTWKEGEGQWAYHTDAHNSMAHHKVSLEPYRIRSREILATIVESLPPTCAVEKAGIDEVFVDLSAYVHDVLVNKLYPDLLAGYREKHSEEPATLLPRPPLAEADLDWAAAGSNLIDAQEPAEGDHPIDWDDIVMLEGARIVRAVRQNLYDQLQFRCSAGIAANKMLSKLGSSQHKPDKQTVVRPRAIASFLNGLSSVTKLRGLGGKMGARVVKTFDTSSLAELRTLSLPQMQAKLDDQEAGHQIYNMVRGVDHSEVTARTEIKSIISAKSFQPPLTNADQARRWLRVYAAEIKCRLLDEKLSQALLAAVTVGTETINAVPDEMETTASGTGSPATRSPGKSLSRQQQRRLPQTIRLHYGVGAGNGSGYGHHWRSRQMRIPYDGTPLDEDKLMRMGTQLLEQAQNAGEMWPCAHLAITVDGFEERVKGNKSIKLFFKKANATSSVPTACSSLSTTSEKEAGDSEQGFDKDDTVQDDNDSCEIKIGHRVNRSEMRLTKRRKTDMVSAEEQPMPSRQPKTATTALASNVRQNTISANIKWKSAATVPGGVSQFLSAFKDGRESNDGDKPDKIRVPFSCRRCSESFADAIQLQEHEDWHVARSWQTSEEKVGAPKITMLPKVDRVTTASTPHGQFVPTHGKRATSAVAARPISSFFRHQARSQTKNAGNASSTGTSKSDACSKLACSRCGDVFDQADGLQVHQDWHLAKDLENG
ncbi:N-acetyltransferase eso1 [Sporothrix epigloea]|uniref:DNA polymerase eta n=1 Tax=Sporothrix epigloea TaxID=1892477 RepID=A0ABP0DW10_9PEZI